MELVQPEEEDARGEVISMFNYLMAGYGENRLRFFLKMNYMRRKDSGEKFQ